MGLFYNGEALLKVGELYANKMLSEKIPCQHLFGPAYKGIPLVTAIAIALAKKKIVANISYNRKETKSHGEGGMLVGAPITGSITLVDDVMTAGTAFRESKQLIQEAQGKISAVVIGLDRCEVGLKDKSAIQEIKDEGIPYFQLLH